MRFPTLLNEQEEKKNKVIWLGQSQKVFASCPPGVEKTFVVGILTNLWAFVEFLSRLSTATIKKLLQKYVLSNLDNPRETFVKDDLNFLVNLQNKSLWLY